MEKKTAQQKYKELIASIRILASRAIGEDKKAVYSRLSRLAKYLEEVNSQRHLCMLSETDRIEKVRYKEVLDYIDMQYDGTEESVRTICEELCEREDIDEVLKYHDKKNNPSKEEER